MPTITFSLKDLQNLVGKKLTVENVQEYAHYGKGDFEGYDKETDEIKIDFGDTNLPYLWSVEGFSRLIKSLLGKEKGIPKIKLNKSSYAVIVDKNIEKIRPYLSGFVAKGHKIDDYLIKQVVQLQEKFCETYGRRRQKVSIGIYSYKKIKFPVHYKATDPESIKFVPLEFKKEMTQQEILEEHPKGKEYAFTLKGFDKYPILVDDVGEVLSFPPIINSNTTGKVEIGESELFVEVTGDDEDATLLASNIFAQALYDRGFSIYSVDVKYPTKKVASPYFFKDTVSINKEQIKKLLGIELNESTIKKLLEKAGYNYSNGKVEIPFYRKDILHYSDVVEDIAISYGYSKIKEEPLTSYTIGEIKPLTRFIDKVREIVVGMGYQEIMSPILSNKKFLYDNMNVVDFGTVEIEQYMSETYSVVRTWLLPILLECLSKNSHVEYPHKIFEQGIVVTRKKEEINQYERIAVVTSHEKVDFTEIKQILDYIMDSLGLKYEIEDTEHKSFIEGRVGRVIVRGKKVAFIGEINPAVLSNWGIEMPVAALELNLDDMFKVIK